MVMPYQWKAMIKAMNMPELADDPRFNTARARRDNNAALKHVIEGWLGGFPSRDAAVAALEAERVPCAPVLTLHEAIAIRICASAEPSGVSGTPRSANSTSPGCR